MACWKTMDFVQLDEEYDATNQKQELHVVAMFANRSGRNEQSS
jgi:hypothetical protein